MTPTQTTLPAPVNEGNITIKEAVPSVTWTAQPGTRIAPGEFGEFSINAGPVPDTDSMQSRPTQTYDDGTVVEWNEPTPASGEEPEHTVPTLTITPAEAEGEGAADAAATSGSDAAATPTTDSTVTVAAAPSSGTSNTAAIVLSIIGIVVAAIALVIDAIALRRRPTEAPSPRP